MPHASSTWFLLRSGSCPPAYNMALDEALLEAAPRVGKPVLRFYGWTEPAASFGYFQRYAEVEHAARLRPLVRRPTGGGIVPHDADWTYSLVFPAGQAWYQLAAAESYRRVHEWIVRAFARLGIVADLALDCHRAAPGQCFAGYEKSDVLWNGRKIAGAAQRRTRNGLLIQGSVQPPPTGLQRTAWELALCNTVQPPDASWGELDLSPQLRLRTEELTAQKYSQASFNQKR